MGTTVTIGLHVHNYIAAGGTRPSMAHVASGRVRAPINVLIVVPMIWSCTPIIGIAAPSAL